MPQLAPPRRIQAGSLAVARRCSSSRSRIAGDRALVVDELDHASPCRPAPVRAEAVGRHRERSPSKRFDLQLQLGAAEDVAVAADHDAGRWRAPGPRPRRSVRRVGADHHRAPRRNSTSPSADGVEVGPAAHLARRRMMRQLPGSVARAAAPAGCRRRRSSIRTRAAGAAGGVAPRACAAWRSLRSRRRRAPRPASWR